MLYSFTPFVKASNPGDQLGPGAHDSIFCSSTNLRWSRFILFKMLVKCIFFNHGNIERLYKTQTQHHSDKYFFFLDANHCDVGKITFYRHTLYKHLNKSSRAYTYDMISWYSPTFCFCMSEFNVKRLSNNILCWQIGW